MIFKVAKTFFLVLVAFALVAAPAFAGAEPEGKDKVGDLTNGSDYKWGYLAAGLGAGIATIGGGLGIGKLAASAMEGTSRQPEAGGDIRTTMIIAAALIEGFTFFAMIICILLATNNVALPT